MDGANLRYQLRPFAAAQPPEPTVDGQGAAMPGRFPSNPTPLRLPDRFPSNSPAATPDRLLWNPAAMPDRLLWNPATMPDRLLPSTNLWSSPPAKPGPSGDPLLAQAPGSYHGGPYASSHVLDLKALLHNPGMSSASNAGSTIDLARAYSPLGAAPPPPPPPKYPRNRLSAGSSVGQQSSLGALFLNKNTSVQGTLPGGGSAVDGMAPDFL
jgi:hypothetical protein